MISPHSGSILPRVALGEETAMNECIDQYAGLVWKIARKYTRVDADAEDLVQDIFTNLWQNASRFDEGVGSELTFIATLARRRAIDWLRSKGRRPELSPLTPEISEMSSPEGDPVKQTDHELVLEALGKLSPDRRELLVLHFQHGMAHGEISSQTGLPLGTVKTRLRAGLVELRKLIRGLDASLAGEGGV